MKKTILLIQLALVCQTALLAFLMIFFGLFYGSSDWVDDSISQLAANPENTDLFGLTLIGISFLGMVHSVPAVYYVYKKMAYTRVSAEIGSRHLASFLFAYLALAAAAVIAKPLSSPMHWLLGGTAFTAYAFGIWRFSLTVGRDLPSFSQFSKALLMLAGIGGAILWYISSSLFTPELYAMSLIFLWHAMLVFRVLPDMYGSEK